MKTLISTFLILLSISFPVQAQEQKESSYDRVIRTGTIRCGYYPWPPYFEKDINTGELKGMLKELYDDLFSSIDLKVEYKEITLGFQVSDLNNDKFDTICGDAPISYSSIKYVDYTSPTFFIPLYTYVKTENLETYKTQNFNQDSITFAAIDGDLSQEIALRLFPKAKLHSISNISDPAQMLMDVTTNKADAVITDPLTASRFLNGNPNTVIPISLEPISVYPISFSVKKGQQNLYNMLDMAQKMAHNAGILDKSMDKYDPDHKFFLPIAKPYEAIK